MLGMMQEKPQPSIRHIQATGRDALKLGTTTIAWAAQPRTRAQSGESTAPGKLCYRRRNHSHGKPLEGKLASRKNHLMRDVVSREKKEKLHNAPNTSIQEPGIFCKNWQDLEMPK